MKRRLIVCADGTWNTAEVPRPTNVVLMARSILPVAPDGTTQVVFYHPGVGTGPFLDRWTGGAFGQGLSNNVKDVYRFLIYNYVPGDDIVLFGFSRGAYTVRSAVGFIRKCGLLLKEHADRLADAYELYRQRDDTPDGPDATAFRTKFSETSIEIALLGVWDTVGSLGIPLAGLRFLSRQRFQFHDVLLSAIVRRAYHAVAIDERRKSFAPTLWEGEPKPNQEVEQVWFSGVHSDIGGGYPEHGLSDVAFNWMKEKAERAGVAFDGSYVAANVAPDYRAPLHDSYKGVFRLGGSAVRPIGRDTSRREAVDIAPIRRLADPTSHYKPVNLSTYLASATAEIAEGDTIPPVEWQELLAKFRLRPSATPGDRGGPSSA
jgi:uncharacterized protein (DUF2235 family)